MIELFVYGTLMKGFPNHHVLDGATFVCNARTEKEYAFLCARGRMFPAMCDERILGVEPAVVYGELYSVTHLQLDKLDRLESVPMLYHRKAIWVKKEHDEYRTTWCQAYFLNPVQLDNFVPLVGAIWTHNPLVVGDET